MNRKSRTNVSSESESEEAVDEESMPNKNSNNIPMIIRSCSPSIENQVTSMVSTNAQSLFGSQQYLQRPINRKQKINLHHQTITNAIYQQSSRRIRRKSRGPITASNSDKMSSSIVTPTSYQQQAPPPPPPPPQSKQCQRSSSASSTIYHSPQSSPNESSPPPPPPSMTVLMDDQDEKPLDFSSKSTNLDQSSSAEELTSRSASKKIHPKFLATKHHQQQRHQAEHHCFTTPSPSPPEHRMSSSLTSLLLPNQITPPLKTSSGFPSQGVGEHQPPPSQPPVNPDIFGKLFQEMTNQIQTIPTTTNHKQTVNETLLNQALQLAKLTSQNQMLPAAASSIVVDSSSGSVDQKQQQESATAQLLNLLSQVNHTTTMQGSNIEQILKTTSICPTMKSPVQPIPPLTLSPMKPIQTMNDSPHSLSPTSFHHLVTSGVGHQANTTTNPHHNHLPFIPTLVNGGGLLTTATTSTNTSPASLLSTLVDSGIKNHNRMSPSDRNNNSTTITTTTVTTPKYTRPFKALYSNKDLPLFHHQSSPSLTTSTSSFPLESLAAQSLFDSDKAYLIFRSQMLSRRQSRSTSRKSSSTSTLLNGNFSNNSVKSDHNSDDSSSNSSFNGTVDNIMNSQSLVTTNIPPTLAISEAISTNNSQLPIISTSNIVSMVNGGSSLPTAATIIANSANSGSSRKRARPLPDNLKDEAYWERRRKNNEAAKRSRDLRRAKEDEIAIRASYLEHENHQLRMKLVEFESKLESKNGLIESLQKRLRLQPQSTAEAKQS